MGRMVGRQGQQAAAAAGGQALDPGARAAARRVDHFSVVHVPVDRIDPETDQDSVRRLLAVLIGRQIAAVAKQGGK
jgi:hypothetical protein